MRRRGWLLTALALVWAAPGFAADLPSVYREGIRQLKADPDPVKRGWAAIGLGQGFRVPDHPGADPRILTALEEASRLDPDSTVRAMAGYGLCVLGDRRGAVPLATALGERLGSGADPEGYYSRAMGMPIRYLLGALARVGGADAVGFLLALTGDRSGAARVPAIWALGLAPEDSVEIDRALAALAQGPDAAVRAAAEQALEGRRLRRN